MFIAVHFFHVGSVSLVHQMYFQPRTVSPELLCKHYFPWSWLYLWIFFCIPFTPYPAAWKPYPLSSPGIQASKVDRVLHTPTYLGLNHSTGRETEAHELIWLIQSLPATHNMMLELCHYEDLSWSFPQWTWCLEQIYLLRVFGGTSYTSNRGILFATVISGAITVP